MVRSFYKQAFCCGVVVLNVFSVPVFAQAPDEDALSPHSFIEPVQSKDSVQNSKKEIPSDQKPKGAVKTQAGFRAAPVLPSNADLKALAEASRFSKSIFRRVARTSPNEKQRAYALRVLAVRSPKSATSHICARALELDDSAGVRRAAAECLGRLPEKVGRPHTAILVAALYESNIDVVTMAAWALANVGGKEALAPLSEGTRRYQNPKVAKLFYTYTERLRVRLNMDYAMGGQKKLRRRARRIRLVPRASEMFTQIGAIERIASTAWLGLYGGMAGWANGGLFAAAHGPPSKELSLLSAIGGVVLGSSLAGAYGFFAAPTLQQAHTVVQLGTFGALTGFGAGLLSAQNPTAGVNAASLLALGTLLGTGTGILFNWADPPSRGALASGFAIALGASVAAGGMSLGTEADGAQSWGFILASAGVSGTLATVLVGAADVGLRAPVFGSVGGILGAGAFVLTAWAVEGTQASPDDLLFAKGSGIGIAAAYGVGAAVGVAMALFFVPAKWDPFLAGIELNPPGFGTVQDAKDPQKQSPMALLSGRF